MTRTEQSEAFAAAHRRRLEAALTATAELPETAHTAELQEAQARVGSHGHAVAARNEAARILHDEDGVSYREIAEMLGVARQTVINAVAMARTARQ